MARLCQRVLGLQLGLCLEERGAGHLAETFPAASSIVLFQQPRAAASPVLVPACLLHLTQQLTWDGKVLFLLMSVTCPLCPIQKHLGTQILAEVLPFPRHAAAYPTLWELA